MRDADVHPLDPGFFKDIASSTPQADGGGPSGQIANLDVAPTDTAPPAGPEGLEDGFLCRPPAGVMLRRRLPRAAVGDLRLGVNAGDEEYSMPLDHLSDPQALGNVRADSQDLHCKSLT